ncbi:MAG: hypothetical protein CSB24_01230 [Deltaproteobacteria bacterium]|nr:MAG: hypothetical protein CSB24_01230 [Deltaproteobacteria bacterium]
MFLLIVGRTDINITDYKHWHGKGKMVSVYKSAANGLYSGLGKYFIRDDSGWHQRIIIVSWLIYFLLRAW